MVFVLTFLQIAPASTKLFFVALSATVDIGQAIFLSARKQYVLNEKSLQLLELSVLMYLLFVGSMMT